MRRKVGDYKAEIVFKELDLKRSGTTSQEGGTKALKARSDHEMAKVKSFLLKLVACDEGEYVVQSLLDFYEGRNLVEVVIFQNTVIEKDSETNTYSVLYRIAGQQDTGGETKASTGGLPR